MTQPTRKAILEAALMAAEAPLSLDRLAALFGEEESEVPSREELRELLTALVADCEGRGVELQEVASGWRYQTRIECAPWVNRLWEERKPRYSRALLETLAIIAYRQPITRAEIEDIRGVAVSTGIVKTLQERDWVKVVGHRDVPGRPAIYATTREFLAYFNLRSLTELPTLAELRDPDGLHADLFAELAAGAADDEEESADTAAVSQVSAAAAHETAGSGITLPSSTTPADHDTPARQETETEPVPSTAGELP